jgi:hypothetical protein
MPELCLRQRDDVAYILPKPPPIAVEPLDAATRRQAHAVDSGRQGGIPGASQCLAG